MIYTFAWNLWACVVTHFGATMHPLHFFARCCLHTFNARLRCLWLYFYLYYRSLAPNSLRRSECRLGDEATTHGRTHTLAHARVVVVVCTACCSCVVVCVSLSCGSSAVLCCCQCSSMHVLVCTPTRVLPCTYAQHHTRAQLLPVQ